MNSDSCIIQQYRPADADRYVRFHTAAESICRCGDAFLLASLKGDSRHPIEFSEKDFLLAEEDGEIVGACRVVPEPAIDRSVLMLLVAPGFLARGVAAALLRSAITRAGDLHVTRVHADLDEKDAAARELFTGLGFEPVRRYTEMMLDLDSAAIEEPDDVGVSLRTLERGGEAEFTGLQIAAFKGSWGFCPNTTAQIIQQLNAPGYGRDGVIIAYHEGEAVGYCWTSQVKRPDPAIGRIHMMGIVPEFRGRGLGKHILWSGLEHLANKGARAVELTMDNENRAARALYEGAGFKPKAALIWYEKKLD